MTTKTEFSKRSLGGTDIQISPIGLGTMEFAGGGGMAGWVFPVIPQDQKNTIVKAALDGGMNWFDTAEIYGTGVSERSLALALKAQGKSSKDVVVATKWWPFLRTARNIPRTITNRLRYLDGFRIDLYMVHQPFGLSSPEAEMDAMADLVEAGKIRAVGVSNFSPERMRRAHRQLQKHGLKLAANQVHYSLLHRQIETDGTLETARELGVTIIAYTPLASGLLTGKYHKNPELVRKMSLYRRSRLNGHLERSRPLIEAMEPIGKKYGATPAQVALNWVIHFKGDSVVTIPGATSVRQAEDNAEAMKFKLSQEDLARLDELSRSFLR